MSSTAWQSRGAPLASTALLFAALGALAVGSTTDVPLAGFGLALVIGTTFLIAHRWLLRWDVLAALLIAVILFIPIRRFVLPGNLPFQLEPYRLFVAFLGAAWGTSLLVDARVRLRRSGFEAPLLLFVVAAVASTLVNLEYISTGAKFLNLSTRDVTTASLEPHVLKALTFFFSFVLVFYFIVSVVRRPDTVDRLVQLLVFGGASIALFSIIESRTGVNVFDRLPRLLPIFQENYLEEVPNRGARLRARGPAEHAIALSAALAMLVPLGIYLSVTTRRVRWWLATAITTVGALAAVSRTGVIMLAIVAGAFLWVRPRALKRAWPMLVPVLVLVHFAIPGTLGTLRESFSPPGGLLAEQGYQADQPSAGRIADLAPSLAEWWEKPTLGQGFGTRVTAVNANTGQLPNAIILDNQWLATLLETGLVGAVAMAWLFARFIRRLTRAARADASPRGWLLGALAASIASVGLGMFFFDALSFVQVAFVLFILMGLGVVTLQGDASRPHLVHESPAR